MFPKTPAFNRRIPIKKKLKLQKILAINNNVKAALKYNVSEAIIRYWKTQLDKLKKASITKD